MTAYADLDTSIIDELPPGQTPVTTVAIPTPGAAILSTACATPVPMKVARPIGSVR